MNQSTMFAISHKTGSRLLDLPKHVLNMVIKSCDYPEIASLRKTCFSLWEYLTNWKCYVSYVQVQQRENSATLKFRVGNSTDEISVEYRSAPLGCEILFENREGQHVQKFLEGEHFHDLFFNDFGLFVHHVKDSVMDEMCLDFDNIILELSTSEQANVFRSFWIELRKVLTRTPPLKIRALKMNVESGHHGAEFLSRFHSQHLKKIHFTPMTASFSPPNPDLLYYQTIMTETLSRLQQWQNAEEIKLENVDPLDKVEHFFHFKKVDIAYSFLGMQGVEQWIKEIMNADDTSRQVVVEKKLKLMEIVIPAERYGEPLEGKYYFSSAKTKNILELICERRRVEMKLIPRSDVPVEAEIIDFDNLGPFEDN